MGQFEKQMSDKLLSLSPGFDKLKLVGRQTDPLPAQSTLLIRLCIICYF